MHRTLILAPLLVLGLALVWLATRSSPGDGGVAIRPSGGESRVPRDRIADPRDPSATDRGATGALLERDPATPTHHLVFSVVQAQAGRRATDGHERPVVGASIELLVPVAGEPDTGPGLRVELFAPAVPALVCTSDGAGRADLERIQPGQYRLRVTAEGFAHQELPLSLKGTRMSPAGRPIALRLLPAGRTARGLILDASGAPLAGALVVLHSRPAARARVGFARVHPTGPGDLTIQVPPHVRTDSAGRFELTLLGVQLEQRLLVLPDRPGVTPLVVRTLDTRDVLSDTEIEVRLSRAVPVVLDFLRPDGSFAPGRISVRDGDFAYTPQDEPALAGLNLAGTARGITRAPGRLELHLPPGSYKARTSPEARDGGSREFSFLVEGTGGVHERFPVEHLDPGSLEHR